MISATEVRKGMVLKFEDRLHYVMSMFHHTPGNLRSVIQVKLRDLQTGTSREVRLSSGDKVEPAHIEQVDMECLYAEVDSFVFMNQESFEQVSLHRDLLGEDVQWLKENMICKVDFFEGRAIAVEVPFTVELEVAETEPALKGATITNVYKPAKLETGATVQVPPFIEVGQIIRVDTRDGKYLERVNR